VNPKFIGEERIILVVGGGMSMSSKLIRDLSFLRGIELVCLMDSINREGNIVRGLVCARDTQLFPIDEALITEAIKPVQFELTRRYQDEPLLSSYSAKTDNRDRNKAWKESLRRVNQGNKTKGKNY
jgi:hypothetical protein